VSKIALSGNPSGAGTFTIASPNSDTDRTLALPDVGGTVAVASSGTPSSSTFLRGDGVWAVVEGTPAGTVITVAMNTAPTGYLKANGAVVSRSTYAALFAAIGTTFGAGDGSTTFALPDLRGEFIRGWDDGRAVDSGRSFGSAQGDAIRNLTGFADIRGDGNPGAHHYTTSGTSGVFVTPANTSKLQHTTGSRTITSSHGIQFDASNQVPTASENRPRNVALLACIKF
jgi:microcystin-dependent protein